MHDTQKAIIMLFEHTKSIPLKLRWIARTIGENHPQKVKHHLEQLEKAGSVVIDRDKKEVIKNDVDIQGSAFVSLPIMGSADCGDAAHFADNQPENFLKISKGLLKQSNSDSIFALKASGNSMNNLSSKIEGKDIDDGDYVIVQKISKPENKDVVVSIIDGCANIKRFMYQGEEIALMSESTEDHPPIFIHESDPYQVVGKVVKIIKNPK